MIISSTQYTPEVDIHVYLYNHGPTTTPIMVRLAFGTTIHLSVEDATRLQLQLATVLLDYTEPEVDE